MGKYGTILHFDGSSWSVEQSPAVDAGLDITSVAVAGSDVFAVAGGNLIERNADGSWSSSTPPSCQPIRRPHPGC